MVKDHPDPRRLDRKRTPTAEEVMKIGRNLMAALHGAIKVQGILVSCTDVTTLSWHAADGPQLAVLKLWFPSTPSKTFDVEFYAGAGVDFFNGGGFKDRWTFFDEPDRGRERGLNNDPELHYVERFRFDDRLFRSFSFYNPEHPDIVQVITGLVEEELAELLPRT